MQLKGGATVGWGATVRRGATQCTTGNPVPATFSNLVPARKPFHAKFQINLTSEPFLRGGGFNLNFWENSVWRQKFYGTEVLWDSNAHFSSCKAVIWQLHVVYMPNYHIKRFHLNILYFGHSVDIFDIKTKIRAHALIWANVYRP